MLLPTCRRPGASSAEASWRETDVQRPPVWSSPLRVEIRQKLPRTIRCVPWFSSLSNRPPTVLRSSGRDIGRLNAANGLVKKKVCGFRSPHN